MLANVQKRLFLTVLSLIQITLQKDSSGYVVIPAPLSVFFGAGCQHNTPGLYCGQTLIAEFYGHLRPAGKDFNKGLYLCGLLTDTAIYGKGQAGDNHLDLVLLDNIDNSGDILYLIPAVDNSKRAG